MAKYFNSDDFKITTTSSETEVIATIELTSGEKFTGIAKYHEGDNFNTVKAEKIAKAKAWRNLWAKFKKDNLYAYQSFKKASDRALDSAMSFKKKENELNDFIKKIVRD